MDERSRRRRSGDLTLLIGIKQTVLRHPAKDSICGMNQMNKICFIQMQSDGANIHVNTVTTDREGHFNRAFLLVKQSTHNEALRVSEPDLSTYTSGSVFTVGTVVDNDNESQYQMASFC